MAGQAGEYHRGEMDIHAQQATFKAVMTGTKWASLAVIVGVLFFTLWFCTAAGFLPALGTAVGVTALGVVLLRARPSAAHCRRPRPASRSARHPSIRRAR